MLRKSSIVPTGSPAASSGVSSPGFEPSPLSSLSYHSHVRVLWIPFPIHAVTELVVFKSRLFSEMRRHTTVAMRDLKSSFPAASEHYRDHSVLRLSLEESSVAFVPSPWENLMAQKRPVSALTVISGHHPDVRRHVSDIRQTVQNSFKWCLFKCVVVDPPSDLVPILSNSMFHIVSTGTKVEEIAESLVMAISREAIGFLTSKIISLSSMPGDGWLFRTPADKPDFGCDDTKGEHRRLVQARAAKRKGDYFLLIGAVDSALMALGETSFSSSDVLWSAATLVAVATARYVDGKPLLAGQSEASELFFRLQNIPDDPDFSPFTDSLSRIESIVMTSLSTFKRASACKDGALPQLARQRFVKEIEERTVDTCEKFSGAITAVKTAMANIQATDSTLLAQKASEAKEYYEQICVLWFAELELYLQEAYHQYRQMATRCYDLEAELCLMLGVLRADQKNVRKLLETISELNKIMKLASIESQLRVARVLPRLCFACGCKRKAVHLLVESALRDKRARAFETALSSLVQAAQWSSIPISLDEQTGFISFHPEAITPGVIAAAAAAGIRRDGAGGSLHGGQNVVSAAVGHSTRIQVSLLMEILDLLHESKAQTGMRCHVASFTLFFYSDYLDQLAQPKLLHVLEVESSQGTFPAHLPPTALPPAIVKRVEPLCLPDHLAPCTRHLSGAQFQFIDKQALKSTILTLNGKRLDSDVVWVCGETSTVEITVTNPFQTLLQLTAVSLRCSSIDHDGVVSASPSYVVKGVMLAPLSVEVVHTYITPSASGYVRIEGVDIRIGQLEFPAPITIPISSITVPVTGRLPQIISTFSTSEVELFGGHSVDVVAKLTSTNRRVPIVALKVSLHDERCRLLTCDGCKERVGHSTFYGVVNRQSVQDCIPMDPGNCIDVPFRLWGLNKGENIHLEIMVLRVEYSAPPLPDSPVPPGVPPAVPVFTFAPKRVLNSLLRVFHVPSIEVTSICLSNSRRFLEVRLRNKSQTYTITIEASKSMPFFDVRDLQILPGAEVLLSQMEISKLPEGERRFPVTWVIRDKPSVVGEVIFDFTEVLRGVRYTEPLENAIVSVAFDAGSHHGVSNWISTLALSEPVSIPALRPVELEISVSAPWKDSIPIQVEVSTEQQNEASMVSGPVLKTVLVGNGVTYHEHFELMAFQTGEQVLNVKLVDLGNMRHIRYAAGLLVEHCA
jgi:hypothetical protein